MIGLELTASSTIIKGEDSTQGAGNANPSLQILSVNAYFPPFALKPVNVKIDVVVVGAGVGACAGATVGTGVGTGA